MIGKLTGVYDSTGEDWAILDCGGVGWLVHCSGRTLGRLQSSAGTVSLLVETRFREGEITLYGFWDGAERDWFRLLTLVQGVGGRVAQALLTVLSPDDLALAIAAENRKRLTLAGGAGPVGPRERVAWGWRGGSAGARSPATASGTAPGGTGSAS